MATMMFVVPPLAGHLNPATAVAGELAARGHRVVLVAHSGLVTQAPAGVELLELPVDPAGAAARAEGEAAAQRLRGVAALRFLWRDFLIPLGASMIDAVDEAMEKVRPDVLVADQQAIAASVVARRRGVPLAVLATTPAEFDDPYAGLDRVGVWVADQLRAFQAEHGLPTGEAAAGQETPSDPRFAGELILVCSVPGLLAAPPPPPARCVGSVTGPRPGEEFPWSWLDGDRPTVLISLGTVTRDAGRRFLRAAAEAAVTLAAERRRAARRAPRAVLVAPPGTADDLAATAPDDLLVRPRVPQLALLPHLSAVVCHAGNNTVCESLAHGLPLVVAPVRDDQPIIARQVERAGAGVRVPFARAGAREIATALASVLDDPGPRSAAAALREQFAAAGGAAAAATCVAELATRPKRPGEWAEPPVAEGGRLAQARSRAG